MSYSTTTSSLQHDETIKRQETPSFQAKLELAMHMHTYVELYTNPRETKVKEKHN